MVGHTTDILYPDQNDDYGSKADSLPSAACGLVRPIQSRDRKDAHSQANGLTMSNTSGVSVNRDG